MNGRVYDPVLGRFLSADPFVDDAGDSQAYNRFSYVSNNPLGYTDPTGYRKFGEVLKQAFFLGPHILSDPMYWASPNTFNKYYGQASGIAISVALYYYAPWLGPQVIGAISGSYSAFSTSLLNGGGLGDAFKAGAIGGVIGYVGGYATGAIGDANLGWFGASTAHGIVGGGIAEIQGGEFRHGFYSSFAGAALPSLAGSALPTGSSARDVAIRTAFAATVGGTVAEIGGGKFANGAFTAAFQHLFNVESHVPADEQESKVAVGFYDSADKGDFFNSIASSDDFKAGAKARSTLAVPVASEKEIANWFKANPGMVDSIGFFGHGNSNGIYINGKEVSSGTIRLFAAHLNRPGKAFFFACEVGAGGGGTPSGWAKKYFYQGQTVYAAKDLLTYHKPFGSGVNPGHLTTKGEADILWMYSYPGERK